MTSVASLLAAHSEVAAVVGLDPRRLSITYLTPRYATSRNVIGLVSDRDEGRPRLVVKLARDRGDLILRTREAPVLRVLEQVVHDDRVPRLMLLADIDGCAALVQSVVPGRHLGRQDLRETRDRWIGSATELTNSLSDVRAVDTASLSAAPDPGAALDRAAETLRGAAGGHVRHLELVERSVERTACLRTLATVECLEHGDLAPPNLLVTPDDRLGVVDWELATLSRLPMHDLVFFLTHAAWVEVEGADDRRLDCVDRALAPGTGWAWRVLRDRATQLAMDADAVPAIVLACWLRYAAATVGRIQAARRDADTDTRADLGGRIRAFVLWRHLAAAAHERTGA